ncbi:hypothetical protein HU200_047146 [Digitaria exilis]|uniref:Uncharacterized protein n=1 Tax=Digitaria exilis TaxID=1010633 RepID=A0A835AXJ6_9POAL|nr:hypothetical protein HU200_047146 [Digitaria exilis]
MEEAKAAAYYDELNRKGEGARRFKQGLGFSSSSDATSFPSKPAASSSFLSGFVRAVGAPSPAPAQAQAEPPKRPPPPLERPSTSRHRSRSPPPSRPRARSRSRSPSRSSRRRSRTRSRSRERRRRSRSRERDRRASRRRSRSRSRSPSRRSGRSSHSEGRRDRHGDRRHDDGRESSKSRGGRDGGKVDCSRLIEGYDRMTPAERVKAKMKLQLSDTLWLILRSAMLMHILVYDLLFCDIFMALKIFFSLMLAAAKDSTLGTATVRWERFEFNKDAPLDEDSDDVEVANDDASLVKNIGKSFRLSAVESKHGDKVRDAHEEAIFGVPTTSFVNTEATEDELKANDEEEKAEDIEAQPSSSLISDKVLAMQKGSWRERAQKLRQDSNT